MHSERDFLSCILFISLFIIYTAKAENSEPELILDGRVNIPVSILKKGLEGTIELQVYIDREGQVENCEIIRGIAPELDSIVRHLYYKANFRLQLKMVYRYHQLLIYRKHSLPTVL